MTQLTVRSGKGNKDRVTTFPAKLTSALSIHMKWIKTSMIRICGMGLEVHIFPLPCPGNTLMLIRNGAGSILNSLIKFMEKNHSTKMEEHVGLAYIKERTGAVMDGFWGQGNRKILMPPTSPKYLLTGQPKHQ